MTFESRTPSSSDDAIRLLCEIGASAHLLQHHRLVVEAAVELCNGLESLGSTDFDRSQVEVGAALHDVGKVLHPHEMHGPGCAHERGGYELLRGHGVADSVARHAWLHASWREADDLEPALVALADKLWKGKRVPELEQRVVEALADGMNRELWDVWGPAVEVFDTVAAGADDRIRRSTRYEE